jgi:DnaJ-class molecular chaperone
VVVNVVIPRRLNREQKELLQQLAGTLTDEHVDTGDESVFSKLRRTLRSKA